MAQTAGRTDLDSAPPRSASGLRDTTRRTGVPRSELLRLERAGLLGHVARWRRDRRRVYTADQLALLGRVNELRMALGITYDEAARLVLAKQRPSGVSEDRVRALRRRALASSGRALSAALYLDELLEASREPPSG